VLAFTAAIPSSDAETLLALSHNGAVWAELESRRSSLDVELFLEIQKIEAEREAAINRLRAGRDADVRSREAFATAVVGGASAGVVVAAGGSSVVMGADDPYPEKVSSCSGDADCGDGRICVRGLYSLRGVCGTGSRSDGAARVELPAAAVDLVKTKPPCAVATKPTVRSGSAVTARRRSARRPASPRRVRLRARQ